MSAAACSGGGTQPGASPTAESQSPSAASTPSATPTPAPSYKPADASGRAQNVPVPVLPEVAKSETKEGLEAFARYWFQLLSYGYETGDTTPLDAITTPGCELCLNVTQAISSNYESGKWLAGGRVETPSVSTSYAEQPDGQYQVVVQVQQAMISYIGPGGTEFRTPTPPSDTGNVMIAEFASGAWRLTGLHPIR
ncbi:DUF6318 family protein [Pseudarthrobacter sp. MM222]|uniref:DUF6318 family protein n=1 Tax=Pseudarthrobacter sp. MM222 TaxID=3018929 RepID=UPI003FA78A4F